MRVVSTIALLALFSVCVALPRCARADVTVEVPEALGLYIADETSRSVLVNFGGPVGDIAGLRIHCSGTFAPGSTLCGGYTYDDWSAVLSVAIEDEGGPSVITGGVLDGDGAFELTRDVLTSLGFAFLEDGQVQMRFYLENVGCGDLGPIAYLIKPQCVLQTANVTVFGVLPTTSVTWSAIKSLYGS